MPLTAVARHDDRHPLLGRHSLTVQQEDAAAWGILQQQQRQKKKAHITGLVTGGLRTPRTAHYCQSSDQPARAPGMLRSSTPRPVVRMLCKLYRTSLLPAGLNQHTDRPQDRQAQLTPIIAHAPRHTDFLPDTYSSKLSAVQKQTPSTHEDKLPPTLY